MRHKIVLGTALIILGFIVYQFGVFIVEQTPDMLGAAAKYFSAFIFPEQSVAFSAIMLKLAGGIVTILGVIVAVNGSADLGDRYVGALQALHASVREMESKIDAIQKSTLTQLHTGQFSCNFCGSKIEKGESFCSTCGRAQK